MSFPVESKVVRFHEFGVAREALKVETESVDEPGEGEVIIEMRLAAINPADINFIEGTYGIKPNLPAVPGNEGMGVIAAIGKNVERFKVGDAVRPPEGVGAWRQYICANVESCIKLPSEVSEEQLAMIYVNPPTAWRMLYDFVELQEGDWIIQNAANSAVGRCVIQIAKHFKWKTINLVRRPEFVEELKALGADAVLLDDENVKESLPTHVKDSIKLVLNAVGGESAARLADCLGKSGTMVTYGAMSKQALKIPNKFLIFKDLHFRGFWMSRWYQQHDIETKEAMLAEIGELMKSGKLFIKVDQVFPLEQVAEAVALAQQPSRNGKVLLKIKN